MLQSLVIFQTILAAGIIILGGLVEGYRGTDSVLPPLRSRGIPYPRASDDAGRLTRSKRPRNCRLYDRRPGRRRDSRLASRGPCGMVRPPRRVADRNSFSNCSAVSPELLDRPDVPVGDRRRPRRPRLLL